MFTHTTRQVRLLEPIDFDAFAAIELNSYPGRGYTNETKGHLKRWLNMVVTEWSWQDIYVLTEQEAGMERLLGGMCLYDLKMNVISTILPVGGIGMVAVDLLRRKEKVAKDLIAFALSHYKSKGTNLVTLYPFEVEFYKQMGFGYGGLVRQYRVPPTSFPRGNSKAHIQFLTDEDRPETLNCYNRFMARHNGMTEKLDKELHDLFDTSEVRMVGYKKDGKVLGYLCFSYERKYDFKSNLVIRELVYETPEVLLELCTFLQSLSDQFAQIVVETQDEYFHFLLNDPRRGTFDTFESRYLETSVVGVGLMYRVLSVPGLFADLREHNFGSQTCTVKITLQDSMFPENNGSTLAQFMGGRATVLETGEADAEISMDVREFSSLIMGAIDFHALLEYGLATISDERFADRVQALFRTSQRPMCNVHV